jgi:hypothetical protein
VCDCDAVWIISNPSSESIIPSIDFLLAGMVSGLYIMTVENDEEKSAVKLAVN